MGLALLALWPWSYVRGYSCGLPPDKHGMTAANNGELLYWWSDVGRVNNWEEYDAKADPMTAQWIDDELRRPFAFRAGSFAFGRFTSLGAYAVDHFIIVVPIWFPASTLIMPLAWRVLRRTKSRRRGFSVITSDKIPAAAGPDGAKL